MEHDTCISCSIGVIGDFGVGKLLIRRFAGENGNVQEKFAGVNATKVIELDGKKIQLSITAECPYRYSSDANIFIYDVTSKDSYRNLTQTVEHVQRLYPKATMLILGNKLDLVEQRQVDFDTVKKFADQKGAKHLELSASNDVSSIEMAFHAVVKDILNKRWRGMKTKHSKKSTRYKDKFQKLLTLDLPKIQPIGPVVVCFDKDFLIGKGRDSVVYIGLHEDGSEVAVKRILSDKNSLKNEVGILDLVNVKKSDHIVNYRAFISDESDVFSYIILDLCEENLEEYIKNHDKEFLEKHGPVIIREILTGLQALHRGENKVLHRDLKPRNILVDVEGHMRLADFGVSRVLENNETSVVTSRQGTEDWMAAESIPKTEDDDVRFKRKSDIQVAGMICFYLLTKGEHPFGRRYCRMQNVMDDSPVNLDMLTDPNAKRFVSWLISHEIKDRPYVDGALADNFLQLPPSTPGALADSFLQLPPSTPDNNQLSPASIPKSPSTTSLDKKPSKKDMNNKNKAAKRSRITKEDIGLPFNFRHVGHVGWDPQNGFDISKLDDSWKMIFSKAGVTDNELNDQETAKFIHDFVEKHGGVVSFNAQGIELPPTPTSDGPPPPPPATGNGPPRGAPSPPPPSMGSSLAPPPPPSSKGFGEPPPPFSTRSGPPPPPSRDAPPPPPPFRGSSQAPPPPPPSRGFGGPPPPPPTWGGPPPPPTWGGPPPPPSRAAPRGPQPPMGGMAPSPSPPPPGAPAPPPPSRWSSQAPPPPPSRGFGGPPPPPPTRGGPPPPPSRAAPRGPQPPMGGMVPSPSPPPPGAPAPPPPPPMMQGGGQAPPPPPSSRGGLLSQIQSGVTQDESAQKPASNPGLDAIVGALARALQGRLKVIHLLDEDDASGSDLKNEDEEDEWDD